MITMNHGITPPRQQQIIQQQPFTTTTPTIRKNSTTIVQHQQPVCDNVTMLEQETSSYNNNNNIDHQNDNAFIQLVGSPNSNIAITTVSTPNIKMKNDDDGTTIPLLAYTIVWSPIPIITWLLPFIGHTGICTSMGIANDFRGPYYVGTDGHMAFGQPIKYYKIPNMSKYHHTTITAEQWDQYIHTANDVYRHRMHHLCCDNCHSHVAYALNQLPSSSSSSGQWNMINIAAIMFFRGTYISYSGIIQQFLPFTIFIGLIILFSKL